MPSFTCLWWLYSQSYSVRSYFPKRTVCIHLMKRKSKPENALQEKWVSADKTITSNLPNWSAQFHFQNRVSHFPQSFISDLKLCETEMKRSKIIILCHKSSEITMISELFFYILSSKVWRDFARNLSTHTPTYTTISAIGQSITNQRLLSPNIEKSEKLFEIWLQNILPHICAEAIILPTVLFLDSTVGFIC